MKQITSTYLQSYSDLYKYEMFYETIPVDVTKDTFFVQESKKRTSLNNFWEAIKTRDYSKTGRGPFSKILGTCCQQPFNVRRPHPLMKI